MTKRPGISCKIYDLSGNVLGISYDVDLQNPLGFNDVGNSEYFTYDNIYRLESADYPNGIGFEYDYSNLMGDRESKIVKQNQEIEQEFNYIYINHFLDNYEINGQDVGGDMEYDLNGNLVYFKDEIGDVYEYFYDSLNRLREVYKNSKFIAEYFYDYINERIKKVTLSEKTFYVYQGGNVVYEEYINYELVCGDCNDDGAVNLLDILDIINYVYSEGEEPENIVASDIDADGVVNLLDILALINFIYVSPEQDILCSSDTKSLSLPEDKKEMSLEELQGYLNEVQQNSVV